MGKVRPDAGVGRKEEPTLRVASIDIGGASAAGLTPVLIDPYDDHAGADFARIKSVADLLE